MSSFPGKSVVRVLLFVAAGALPLGCHVASLKEQVDPVALAGLGEALFFDSNLSQNRSQSCATCHDPDHAFTDPRDNGVGGAVSLGDDGHSLGDRNSPTAAYISLTPEFHRDELGHYVGGLFHDGRAATPVDQAGDPITNPIEMGLADRAALSERIHENPGYIKEFKRLFGESFLSDSALLDRAIRRSIAAFEQTDLFAPFDSRYDRYLRGEYKMNRLQELGRQLFFSDLINCSSCHLLNRSYLYTREPFTNYRYHNIGTPTNIKVRRLNGVKMGHQDRGLLDNPAINDPEMAGKFKVPTLRNVAVTAPYMHNGVFRDLRTTLLFYSKYLVDDGNNRTNPETGLPWAEPEHADNLDLELLRQGQPLDDHRVEALLAFLETLTDQRYEALLESNTGSNTAPTGS